MMTYTANGRSHRWIAFLIGTLVLAAVGKAHQGGGGSRALVSNRTPLPPYLHAFAAPLTGFASGGEISRHPPMFGTLIEGTSYWKDPSKKELVIWAVASFLKLDREKDREQLDGTFRTVRSNTGGRRSQAQAALRDRVAPASCRS